MPLRLATSRIRSVELDEQMAKRTSAKKAAKTGAAKHSSGGKECFLIMPISDPVDYKKGHFQRVRDDLFRPACEAAGFQAIRADETTETNLIQLDILRRLIEAPIAICDLSTRNPNVMFELGIRQAFDKPVVLVQEEGTQRIFDISGIRIIEYRKELLYREVLQDQKAISDALVSTATPQPGSINSLIRLLSLSAAKLDDSASGDIQGILRLILSEVSQRPQQSHAMPDIAQKENDQLKKRLEQPERYFVLNVRFQAEGIKKLLQAGSSVSDKRIQAFHDFLREGERLRLNPMQRTIVANHAREIANLLESSMNNDEEGTISQD